MKSERNSIIVKTSVIGIVVNFLLALFKAVVGWISNSIAITLDSVNNLTDAISSIITIIGNHLSGKDPDKKHPFGYGRIEYLSTMAIGVLISYAGVTALIESIKRIIKPEVPEYTGVVLIVLGSAIVVKLLLGFIFIRNGKKVDSGSLVASGKDALSDVLISVGTVIAAVVYLFFKISLEAYLGIIISALIIKSGIETLIETISQILGEGASVELVKNVKKTITSHEGVMGAYDLIFNNYGHDVYVASVHMEVVDTLTANEIDMLARHITEDVRKEHGVLLSAIGIYSHNTSNPEIINLREKFSEIVLSHEHVNQLHGFYADLTNKIIRFDMVISFDAKSRAELYEHVINDLKVEFPEFEISGGMDADFNEISK